MSRFRNAARQSSSRVWCAYKRLRSARGVKENASKHAHIHIHTPAKYVRGAGESGVTPAGAAATPCGLLIPFSLPDMSYRRASMKRKAGEAGAGKHGRPSGRSK